MYDVIVVGSGFSGAVIARELAEKLNKKVLILEKRSHIGGNMYESFDTNGVSVHWYGPHIFHTNNEKVFEYLQKFSKWFKYEHKVIGQIDGQLVSIPFNFKSIDILFNKDKAKILKKRLMEIFPSQSKVSILDLINHTDSEIKEFGEYVFEKVFVHYTAKQWGIPVEEVDKSVINRVPVILGYDERYFQDKIQYMPEEGYTAIFENMLKHSNIEIQLNSDATKRIKFDFDSKEIMFDGNKFDGALIYTGAIDELLDFKFGQLPYRSLDLVFEQYEKTYYQSNSVVNYPNDFDFTRITEFKYLSKQKIEEKTTILKEFPLQWNSNFKKELDPYYPIINEENLNNYEAYRKELSRFKNIYLCGRLAEYKYYNMDAAIEKALELALSVEV